MGYDKIIYLIMVMMLTQNLEARGANVNSHVSRSMRLGAIITFRFFSQTLKSHKRMAKTNKTNDANRCEFQLNI